MKQTDKFCEYCVPQNDTIVPFCSEQGKSDDYLMERYSCFRLKQSWWVNSCLELLKQGECSGLYAT